jgi:RND family efflux transporter MFP subunit
MAKPFLEKRAKKSVPVWYRRSRTYWAGGAIVALLATGSALRYKFAGGDRAEEITAMVKRANLPITVTERGDVESSKTIEARCEVEGTTFQNKIATILPEGTKVKGAGWFWWEPGQMVVTFDKEKLRTDYLTRDISYKTAVGKAKAAKGELEVQTNKAEGEIADAKLALDLAELDRDKYLGQDSALVKRLTVIGMVTHRLAGVCPSLAHVAFYYRSIAGEYQVDVNEKNGDIELAKKELKEAEDKLEQYRKFVKKGFGTPEQLRVNELALDNKKYNLQKMEAKLRVLQDFMRKRQETELTAKAAEAARKLDRAKKAGDAAVEKAQSDLDAAVAAAAVEKQALDRIQDQLNKCVIRAPADGILVYARERFWDPNSQIRAGAMVYNQQKLFELPDLSQMQVKVRIHESMVKRVKPRQKADISIEAMSDLVLHGTVENVGILAENAFWEERGVKQYMIKVKIDDLPENSGLNPGMTAQVKIHCGEVPDVLLVPVQAVAENEGKHYAYVKGSGIERREVEVGETNEKFVEVKSGLEEGEKVVLDARSRLTAETKASEKKGEGDQPKAGDKKKENEKDKEQPKAAPPSPTPAPAPAAPVATAPAKG